MVTEQCGLTLGRGIHTTLSDTECPDWEFPIHPDMRIVAIKQFSE
ncbi:hypothetical protein [uncultured Alistipes sp.]|nr:hypothetical protein [uncultured Alistipes sp.]